MSAINMVSFTLIPNMGISGFLDSLEWRDNHLDVQSCDSFSSMDDIY